MNNYVNILHNLEEWHRFLETNNLLLSHEELSSLNRLDYEGIESIIRDFPTYYIENPRSDEFIGYFYQPLKEDLVQGLLSFSNNLKRMEHF